MVSTGYKVVERNGGVSEASPYPTAAPPSSGQPGSLEEHGQGAERRPEESDQAPWFCSTTTSTLPRVPPQLQSSCLTGVGALKLPAGS